MNLEVKRAGPSFPADIQSGFEAYCKYLDEHPEYEISEGNLLLFVVSRVSGELTAAPRNLPPGRRGKPGEVGSF